QDRIPGVLSGADEEHIRLRRCDGRHRWAGNDGGSFPRNEGSGMQEILSALRRARLPIVWMALANVIGIGAGMALVHAGYGPAVAFRDRLVGRAVQSSSILGA